MVPFDCERCPDRGKGNGVTVRQIKEALAAAPDNASLSATWSHYRRHLATLSRSKTEGAKTMLIQIENLEAYRRKELKRA